MPWTPVKNLNSPIQCKSTPARGTVLYEKQRVVLHSVRIVPTTKLHHRFPICNIPLGESTAAPLLFDLSTDPVESIDVAAENPQRRDRLFKEIVQ